MVGAENNKWLSIRQEIRLLEDSYKWGSNISYHLHDPASNVFYKIGPIELEILKNWQLGSADEIVKKVNQDSHFHIINDDVEEVKNFLSDHNLLQKTGIETSDYFHNKKEKSKKNWFIQLSKKYLFLRIPLFKPDKYIESFHARIRHLISIKLFWLVLLIISIGLVGVVREWEYYLSQFGVLLTAKGAVYILLSLVISKITHEIAHALATKHFGCKIYQMGVAFIVLFPMLWTDTSDSWRLKGHKKHLWISGSGILAELSLAGLASFLWVLLPEGELKLIAFVLSSVTWIGSLLINLNPFMKFDGYYLLSDFCKTPNLQSRSISYTLVVLRKKIIGWTQPLPESLSASYKKFFVSYGLCCLIYRCFLYITIALVVYNMLPSPLGFLMAFFEIYWFILLPFINEIKLVLQNKNEWYPNKIFKNNTIIASIILAIVVLPTSNNFEGSAVYRAYEEIKLSTSKPVKLIKKNIKNSAIVKKDDILFYMESPEINADLGAVDVKLKKLSSEFQYYITSPNKKNDAYFVKEEIASTQANKRNILQQKKSLHITSPINGKINDIPDSLALDDWLEANEFLGYITSKNSYVEAFISEYDIKKISLNNKAIFFPSKKDQKPIEVKVTKIEKTAINNIAYKSLVANHGGEIQLQQVHDKKTTNSYYRVLLAIEGEQTTDDYLVGSVVIKGEYKSILEYVFVKLYSLIIREFSI